LKAVLLKYVAVACWSSAIALICDEMWDYHKLGKGCLKLGDILNPRSHEFTITVLFALGSILWLL